jgi:hypothetical protein
MAEAHDEEYLRARFNLHEASAREAYFQHLFGDEFGKTRQYGVDGIEAIALYLLSRDRIPVERTLTYSTEHLSLLLAAEMLKWNGPKIDFRALGAGDEDDPAANR